MNQFISKKIIHNLYFVNNIYTSSLFDMLKVVWSIPNITYFVFFYICLQFLSCLGCMAKVAREQERETWKLKVASK